MNKKSNSYLALNAMRRASQQALERAASKDLKIPIWKNGKVFFVNATDRVEFPSLHSKNKLSKFTSTKSKTPELNTQGLAKGHVDTLKHT